MRTIRTMSLTVLALICLAGVGSYFATANVHDRTSDSSLLFTLAWIFSGFGIVAAAGLIAWTLDSAAFGSRALIGEMFSWLALGVVAVLIFLGIGAGIASGYVPKPGATDGSTIFDGVRFASIYVGGLAGLILGFFAVLLITAQDSWFDEQQASELTQLRKVS
ncbi:MAG: hypothetical protein JWN38_101 [Candidatus Saccharibacteria bacterium]|nr:hypothetical protein [Candidatus Saccharibacteria bacterium]